MGLAHTADRSYEGLAHTADRSYEGLAHTAVRPPGAWLTRRIALPGLAHTAVRPPGLLLRGWVDFFGYEAAGRLVEVN